MLGSIAGDIIGSIYEWNNIKSTGFPLFTPESTFTDDTVLTIAIADSILSGKPFAKTLWQYGNKYPDRGYGTRFSAWLRSENPKPYNSLGNGSAMRVSPVAHANKTLEEVLEKAKETALPTHNHPQGIKGAQSVAATIFLAKHGKTKKQIKEYITKNFRYNLSKTLDEIRPHYEFDETCSGTVPQAITAFLESTDFESAIRLAISIGGDSDTIACITGSIASAYYKHIPKHILVPVLNRLPKKFISILTSFSSFTR